MTTYKPAKNAQEQIEYLKTNKKITFNSTHEQQARDILFKYNYINVITPYKHHFSKFDKDGNEVKIDVNIFMKEMLNLANISIYSRMKDYNIQ